MHRQISFEDDVVTLCKIVLKFVNRKPFQHSCSLIVTGFHFTCGFGLRDQPREFVPRFIVRRLQNLRIGIVLQVQILRRNESGRVPGFTFCLVLLSTSSGVVVVLNLRGHLNQVVCLNGCRFDNLPE